MCRPTEFKRIHTNRFARAGIVGAVVVAAVLWLPTCFLKEPKVYDECDTTSFIPPDNRTWWVDCMILETRNNAYFIAYSWFRQVLVAFLPILILIALNVFIVKNFVHLRKKRASMRGTEQSVASTPEDEARQHNDQNLIKLLMAVMISFFITIVPAGIFNAIYTEVRTTELRFEIFRAIANDLEMLNHAINFYMYVLCSKPIRESIRNFLSVHQCCVTPGRVRNVKKAMQAAVTRMTGTSNTSSGRDRSTSKTDTDLREQQDVHVSYHSRREKSKTTSRDTIISDAASDRNSSGYDRERQGSSHHLGGSSTEERIEDRSGSPKALQEVPDKAQIPVTVTEGENSQTGETKGHFNPTFELQE